MTLSNIVWNLIFPFLFITFILIGCSKKSPSNEVVKISLVTDYSYIQPCPPCQTEASISKINEGKNSWPTINPGELLKINSLIEYNYELTLGAYPNSYWNISPWWSNNRSDPWSNFPFWGENYVSPNHNFDECVNDELRWRCGYSFIVETPKNYNETKQYPLVIFLHGSVESNAKSFEYREGIRNSFFNPIDDPFIYAAPIKLEIDWDPKKISDVIENIKKNMNVDEKRIYLTGLSMGGRGTFIVASDLPDTFAAIMPLSPHHGPYSYVSLAKKVKHIPIWMSHGTNDNISSYNMAKEMSDSLKFYGANIKFESPKSGHWGWESIYAKDSNINWLLSWKLK